jgi:hypothetical protein
MRPPDSLDENAIAAQQALVRGQLVSRLERLHGRCEDRMNESDPVMEVRWAELSVRILRDLAEHYRLGVKQDKVPDSDAPGAEDAARSLARQVASSQLDELSARLAGK